MSTNRPVHTLVPTNMVQASPYSAGMIAPVLENCKEKTAREEKEEIGPASARTKKRFLHCLPNRLGANRHMYTALHIDNLVYHFG